MIKNQKYNENQLHLNQYSNGQLAVYLLGQTGEPIAELSIMHDSVELALNEFVLKDYSENSDLATELLESNLIVSTDRYILIGSHLCPICQVIS
ncbi:MAG: hypothetical protein ACFFCE_19905 [Promethearchaeota archaeon]